MRHPFEGIIIPQAGSENSSAEMAGDASPDGLANPSRRVMLRTMTAAAASISGFLGGQTAAAEEEFTTLALGEEGAKTPGEAPRAIYYVVPKDEASFTSEARKKLGVFGPLMKGWTGDMALGKKAGALAWLTAKEAMELSMRDDLESVVALGGRALLMRPPGKLGPSVQVSIGPNGWMGQAEGTFASKDDVARQLKTRLAAFPGIGVSTVDMIDDQVTVSSLGGIPNEALGAICGHPQVYQLTWASAEPSTRAVGEEGGGEVTTFAVGEEGGATTLAVGEEGGATTKRLGEEGGVSTRALGEEGGRPPATTNALGEEGGKPPVTTEALGEEGGKPPVTTKAVGEEGGTPPPTTKAVGEEGGPTTLAVGEEGGTPPKPPMPSTKAVGEEGGKATTLAIGEEGGKPKPLK